MAHHDMNTMMSTPEMIWELGKQTFRKAGSAFGRFIENNAYAKARMAAAVKVAQMSDEELEAKGMSRAFAIQVALGRFD